LIWKDHSLIDRKEDEDMQYDDLEEEIKDEYDGLKIKKKKLTGYGCLIGLISRREEAGICRPWRQWLIVKLTMRHVDFKTPKTILKQTWVQK
jgi:hypothetical protein